MAAFSISLASRAGLILILTLWCGAGFAQKLVNPDTVAPEYREAAQKRRAEQIKLFSCTKKADADKIMRRDRAKYISQCIEK